VYRRVPEGQKLLEQKLLEEERRAERVLTLRRIRPTAGRAE
jgi:hypothetical protein